MGIIIFKKQCWSINYEASKDYQACSEWANWNLKQWCYIVNKWDILDKFMIFTRLYTHPNKKCIKEPPNTWRELIRYISHLKHLSSIEKESYFYGVAIILNTVPFILSIHMSHKLPWCQSPGIYSLSIHSCGVGKLLWVSFMLLTA